METRNLRQAPIHTPELVLSDSEDSYYSSEDEMSERDQTNHLLRQAHHYVITEGGKDSPTTYMERIQRIDRILLQEIVKHNYECDTKLYRAVRQKVDHVQREFEDAVDADCSGYAYDKMPEYYAAAAEDALYRRGSSPVTTEVSSARHKTQSTAKDERERTYLYGGPGNDSERWYKNCPASVPFPETIRMADWESLRVHYDLATTGNLDNKEPAASVNVSLEDSLLAQHGILAQYESGSRFKLPTIQPSDMAMVNKTSTSEKLSEAVDAFNQGDNTIDVDGVYNYVPSIFLDKLEVGHHTSPPHIVEDVRSADDTAPIRPHPSSSGNGDISSAPSATLEPPNKQQASTSGPNEGTSYCTVDVDDCDNLLITSRAPLLNELHSRTTNPERSSRTVRRSPGLYLINTTTKATIRSSPQPQSPPAQPEATQTQTATSVLIPMKTPYGSPRKNLVPAATTPEYLSTAGGTKRKYLSKDANYKPLTDEEEDDEEANEAEALPAKRKRTTSQYHSVFRFRRKYTKPLTPTAIEHPKTPAVTPAPTPASGSSVASTPPVVKARTVGKQKRKIRTKRDFEERVSPENYSELMGSRHTPLPAERYEGVVRRSTRSGKVRAV